MPSIVSVKNFGGIPENDWKRRAKKVIRATDAKEVGVENPSEETFCRPDQRNWCPDNLPEVGRFVNR
jgi:hypothetical protein